MKNFDDWLYSGAERIEEEREDETCTQCGGDVDTDRDALFEQFPEVLAVEYICPDCRQSPAQQDGSGGAVFGQPDPAWRPDAHPDTLFGQTCPDGGTCHHDCGLARNQPLPCFRNRFASPLSSFDTLGRWPAGGDSRAADRRNLDAKAQEATT